MKRDNATASARNAIMHEAATRQSPAKREGGGFATAVSGSVKKAPPIKTRRVTNSGPFRASLRRVKFAG